jgi:hypothetical protein
VPGVFRIPLKTPLCLCLYPKRSKIESLDTLDLGEGRAEEDLESIFDGETGRQECAGVVPGVACGKRLGLIAGVDSELPFGGEASFLSIVSWRKVL